MAGWEVYMPKRVISTGGLALAVLFLVSGCSGQPLSTREKGTGIGAVLGAGTGAIIGAAGGHPRAGAAIGGAFRAAAGGAVWQHMEKQDGRNREKRSRMGRKQEKLKKPPRDDQKSTQDKKNRAN